MSLAFKAAVVGAFATTALAHGTVTGFKADGVYYPGFSLDYYYKKQQNQPVPEHYGWYAENLDNGFVEPNSFKTSTDIACHKNAAVDDAKTATVAAGGTVDFMWSVWPESHIGPVITYVASCGDDCSTAEPGTPKFVKIAEEGYDGATDTWAAKAMIKTNNTASVTVPSTLKAGKYVFRHEIIALHGGGDLNGAQNYPQCVNIEVTGSGTELPEGTLAQELYTPTDPGIKFNPYQGTKTYPIPGPKVMAAGSGSGSTPTTPTTPTNTTTPVESSPAETEAPTTTAPPASATSVAAETPVATPSATATPTPEEGSDEGSDELPETFTLETFIAWLKKVGGSSVARRHVRDFF